MNFLGNLILLLGCVLAVAAGSQKVAAYVNKYGVDVSKNTESVDFAILAFLYPDNAGGGLGVKLGGALQGWHPPKQFSLSGSGYGAFRSKGGKVYFSIGGAAFSSRDWRMLIGKEAQFASAVRTFVSGVEKHPDNSGVKIDGIDLDYEDNTGIYNKNRAYDGVKLMVDLSRELKKQGFEVSHAPQGPYLCTPTDHAAECLNIFPGYLYVMNEAEKSIDNVWIQYYNNPSFNTPAEAASQMEELIGGFAFNGTTFKFPAEKLYVGKPGAPGDAGSGWTPPATIGSKIFGPICKKSKNVGGTMYWEFSNGQFANEVKKAMESNC